MPLILLASHHGSRYRPAHRPDHRLRNRRTSRPGIRRRGAPRRGATVPFVARYRKEATGGLDDTQLRSLADRLAYLRELEARRATILGSIREQEKLTPELEASIAAATSKAVLEDLYLPYKPKRRTRAAIAREKGLGPLAEAILADRRTPPETLAAVYVTDEVPDVKEALAGARDILTEGLAEDAALLGRLRAFLQQRPRS